MELTYFETLIRAPEKNGLKLTMNSVSLSAKPGLRSENPDSKFQRRDSKQGYLRGYLTNSNGYKIPSFPNEIITLTTKNML